MSEEKLKGKVVDLVTKRKKQLLFSEKELDEMGILSAKTLRSHRSQGIGLPYVRIGRTIRYRRDHIVEYLKRNTVRPS